jgi:hypothetical protein
MSTTIHQKEKNFGQDQRYQTIVSTYKTNFIYILHFNSPENCILLVNEISSRLTIEHFTFCRNLIGVGTHQEIVRKANPKSYRLSVIIRNARHLVDRLVDLLLQYFFSFKNAKTAKLSLDTKKKFRSQTSKLRRNANKKKALKAHEEKRRRKFKKDQALRIRQEKLQKNLHKLGVDLKETTLPLDLPLTAPIYLPLGTTLVLSDISSIKIEYSNTCATVEHGKNSRIRQPFQH